LTGHEALTILRLNRALVDDVLFTGGNRSLGWKIRRA
jgi:hypothetical protein